MVVDKYVPVVCVCIVKSVDALWKELPKTAKGTNEPVWLLMSVLTLSKCLTLRVSTLILSELIKPAFILVALRVFIFASSIVASAIRALVTCRLAILAVVICASPILAVSMAALAILAVVIAASFIRASSI
jgi:hypothetical protein